MIILAFAENAIQLVPDGTLLLHLLILVVMVFVLNRTLFRPVNQVLAEREAQTSGKLSEAKKLRADFESTLSRYERGLREARSKAYHLVEIERTEALRVRDESVTQVKEEIRTLITREKSEIERQVEEARRTLALESIQSAIQIGSQILHRPVSDTGSSSPGAQ
jgi:F-type H+-transporting ATPase subunit b